MNLKFKKNFFGNYLRYAPLALAIERTWECKLLEKKDFKPSVLDVGSGDGIFSYILFEDTVDVGLDPNEHEIKRCRTFNKYNELLKGFGQNIPKMSESFQTIFSNSVLEHIPDIDAVLLEIHRVLKKGGCLYVTLPTDKFEKCSVLYCLLSFLGFKKAALSFSKTYNKFWKHFHCYNTSTWENKFKQNGFQIIEKIEYGSWKQCFLNDFFSYLSIIPYLTKKASNKWFFSENLRSCTSFFLNMTFSLLSELKTQAPGEGSLIFFELKKK